MWLTLFNEMAGTGKQQTWEKSQFFLDVSMWLDSILLVSPKIDTLVNLGNHFVH